MPRIALCFAPLLALACTEPEVEAPITPPLPQAPSGTCPTLDQSDLSTFESNGRERRAQIYFPDSMGPGKPVLFLWYGVGDTGNNLQRYLRMATMANDEDAIIVIPRSLPENPLEWGFLNGGEDDLALYDDIRSCLYTEHQVDLTRVYSTGFSGGGLWTTFLTMHRSDTLAAILTFSGGTEPIVEFDHLEWNIPALVSWGGDDDVWGAPGLFEVEFAVTSMDFRDELTEDGHTTIACDHGLGHNLPDEARDMIRTFLFAHTYRQPSPFAEGELEGLPSFCERTAP